MFLSKFLLNLYLFFGIFAPKVLSNSCKEDEWSVTCNFMKDLLNLPNPEKQKIVSVLGDDDLYGGRSIEIKDFLCDEPKFENFTSLRDLWLSNVYLAHISDVCFKGLKNIEKIDLGQNSLTKINMRSFLTTNVSKLKHLFLRNNYIDEIDFADVELPELEGLYVSDNRLKFIEVESKYFPHINSMDFAGNQITSFQIESKSMTVLNLSRNRIKSFQGSNLVLPNLKIIFLLDNSLVTITPDMMANMPNLQYIFLYHNHLTAASFPTLKHLNVLDLNYNEFKNLRDLNLTAVDQIDLLNLDSNKISQFNEDQLLAGNITAFTCNLCLVETIEEFFFTNSMKNLQRLSLVSNNLTSADIFSANNTNLELTIVDLSNNRIKRIGESDFERLTKVQELYLDNNRITSIEDGAFNALRELRTVSLKNNTLLKLPENLFEKSSLLTSLRLSGNNLTYFHIPSKENDFANLQELSIHENPLQCKCVELIRSWTKMRNISLEIDDENLRNDTQSACIVCIG